MERASYSTVALHKGGKTMSLPNEPITRTETYLASIAGQNIQIPDEPITRTEMYLDAIARSGGTGEGDMKKSVYDSDLSVASAGGISSYVTSAISGKANASDLGTAAAKDSTNAVTSASTDLVESGAVYTALQSKADKSDIAPTYATNVAPTGGLKKGDEFYLSDGILYRATTTISAGSAIVTSGGSANAEVADSVTGQITNLDDVKLDNRMIALSKNTDLNTLTLGNEEAYAVYYATSSVASTLTNAPFTSTGFRLELKRTLVGGDRLIQTVYRNSSANMDVYYRIKDSSGWTGWIQYAFTDLVNTKTPTTVIGNVEDGASPSKSYAVGEHMIRGGKFCTVTSPVTTGSTWTLNTNYVEGTVAESVHGFYKLTVTPATGIGLHSNNARCLTDNKMVLFHLAFGSGVDLTANTWKEICTVPTGFRPAYNVLGVLFATVSDVIKIIELKCDTDGKVSVSADENMTGVKPYGEISWIIGL